MSEINRDAYLEGFIEGVQMVKESFTKEAAMGPMEALTTTKGFGVPAASPKQVLRDIVMKRSDLSN